MKVKLLLILSIFYFGILFGYCATISVDINNIEAPQGNWIVLANGSWNDWGWGVQLYDDDNDGVFQGTQCNLENNSYGYVHTITGEFDSWSGWGMVSNAPYNSSCDFIPNDPWLNYGFEINNNDIITQVNSWGECGLVDSYYPIASLVKPANGDILNYIYIPFEWSQFPNAIGYNLQVSETDSFNSIILDYSTEDILFIAKENFEWGGTYYWRIQPILSNGEVGEWTNSSMFSIGPQEFNLTSEILTQDNFLYEYTVFGDWNNYRTSIVDINGKEVWNSGLFGFMMNHVSEFGQLFGCSQISNGSGIEIDYNEQIVWNATQIVDQHEFKQISNNNYMGFVGEMELGPIPIGDWTSLFQQVGYQADGITNEFPFWAQKLVEFDLNTKEEIWSWNPHDYYSKQDTDLYGGTWWTSSGLGQAGSGSHDWTHSNAFFFDEPESSIYISSRHLSRITKIDYPSGDIIWMMGLPSPFMYSGDEHICSDLEFSFQHNIQKLDNGNLLFFDNGNLDYIFGYNDMTSRAIEVEVIDDSYCNIIWEYILPTELASYGMGSVQALENGNYFINSTGGGVTILEVNHEGEILWKLNLELTWPNGSGYRAYRIPSIHPGSFSVLSENFKTINLNDSTYNAIELNTDNNYIKFIINNHSGYRQPYEYEFQNIIGDSFEEYDNSIVIDAYSSTELIFSPSYEIENLSEISFNIKPQFHPNSEKTFYFNIYNNVSILYGDLNFDGIINVVDIVALVNGIINGGFTEEQLIVADINGDGTINVIDIVSLIDIIIN